MKNKKLDTSILFYNDRFVMVFSVLTAIVLWFIMATVNTQERPRIIYDVPVTIKLSDASQEQGLKVFDQTVKTAKVSIRGNSIVVNRIKPENIQVVASLASSITQPNNYTLPLTAQKVGSLADYEIVSIEPSSIIANVDVYKEVTFPVQDNITFKADPNYFVSPPSFSEDTVVISGPESEIAKIKKVSAEYEVKETLTKNKSFTTDLVLYNAYGEKLSTDKLTMSNKSVDVNITVLARKVVKLSPAFTGKPVGLALASAVQKITPETIEVAGPEDVLANLNELSLEAIDFSKLSINNQNLQVDITLPPGCKNLSNVYTATVNLNFNGFKSKKLSVTDFQVKNLAASKSAQVFTKSLEMTLIGPAKQIDAVTAADVFAQIDLAGKDSFTGHSEFPVTLVTKNNASIWAFGEYKANVSVTEKAS
ncbi:MAG: CdaR family protein [Clostridium sp.]|uniref:CdaR family protein n=1 Tax=Clostridium sp. TaxID=1506 RepID=UPI002915B98F|nr:CdaR family protein [Clostridium sp.]MDU7339267.1 CdaR family protein [Clostridium sp.]